MIKNDYLIKVRCEDGIFVHIRNIGPTDHVTVCGLDGNDDSLEQEILPLKKGDKMNCSVCRIFYNNRHGLNIKKQWIAEQSKD